MKLPSRRVSYALGALACAALLGYAYFAQYVQGLEPCPLCIFQRIAFFGLFVVFLAAALHNPRRVGARVYGVLILLVAAAGAGVAARHVWIQHLPPDQVPQCGADLAYMLDTFPLTETIKQVLTGSGDCALVDWRFLGLAMPAWALICFVGLGLLGLYRSLKRH